VSVARPCRGDARFPRERDERLPTILTFSNVPTRSQLSLFVPPDIGIDIEGIRRIADPVQRRLIPAHVTLCREDEITGLGLADLQRRLSSAGQGPVTLQFGPPERFAGHGILLPCIGGASEFQALRETVLAARDVRSHHAHLTLAHPRNPMAPGNALESAMSLGDGLRVTFGHIHLIEQVDDAPWVVRGMVPLLGQAG
jgi:2'-5' RNA ligase